MPPEAGTTVRHLDVVAHPAKPSLALAAPPPDRALPERTVWQDPIVVSNVHRLRRAFDETEVSADVDMLNALLADDFRSIGEQGYVLDKAQWIGKFAEFAYTSLESREVEVSFYGHAAIVRCVQRSRSSWRGQDLALTVRVSQTWIELPEGWRLAGIQFSSLAGE
ncbi:nuclear transport factor 2 family protein [Micromonospora sp. DT31]|uniref:nuclear transport factor 2 family protein n=1 Tax=Micromonospora sp. DT31 TaxID=3393434 RepID=UPI003CE9BB62